MHTVRTGPPLGLVATAALLAVLAATVGLGTVGWLVGLGSGTAASASLHRGLASAGRLRLGPADRITLVRATLVTGVAALVADGFVSSAAIVAIVALSVVALVLDTVDGQVARITGTQSTFGARFDMEVDAFLILVLSVDAARTVGPWVLAIGAARYMLLGAERLLPWLRAPVPPRYWRKFVAAVQGSVLTVAAAQLLPVPAIEAALIASLALLVESFGRDVMWLWRARRSPGRRRVALARSADIAAFLLVWAALAFPDHLERLTPAAFARIPVEGLVLLAVVLVLPARVGQVVAGAAGAVIGLLALVKLLDIGFFAALDRPFNPVSDWSNFTPAVGVLRDSIGRGATTAVEVGAVLLALAILTLVPAATMRLAGFTARHRGRSARAVTVATAAWTLCAVFGAQFVEGAPIASTSASTLVYDQVNRIRSAVRDGRDFAAALHANDPLSRTPARDLLTGLRGKDVIIAFVESYGRVAVQGSSFSAQDDAVLEAGTRTLNAAGFASRSAFLTSPTFGGISWLAHSTLQSGLWVDSQQRYDRLVSSDRFTLSDAFRRAGWRTVGDVPSNGPSWPPGTSFYHYARLYDADNVGYAGPRFSYATMPDQYILSAFRSREMAAPHRRPVMAEIDLVSSHTPWAPLPRLVAWNAVGDGSVFDPMPAQGQSPNQVWTTAGKVQAAYGQSIRYSLNTLVSFVQTTDDKNLVLVVLGDHQPATVVSGSGASHDVPISIIAHDPAVLARVDSWGWQDGLLPGPRAAVEPMDAFRDRFLTAFGPAR